MPHFGCCGTTAASPPGVAGVADRPGRSDPRPNQKVSRHRLLNLVGSGGSGKTSVAIATATNLIGKYADGVGFVDLTAIRDLRLVSEAVAAAVGLDISDNHPSPSLMQFLGDKQLLLVLDNCEHVIDGVASLAFRVLRAAPGVHILATSRVVARFRGIHLPASASGAAADFDLLSARRRSLRRHSAIR